jgi:hypothetical protein
MQKAIEEEKSEESVCVLNGRVNNEKNDFYPPVKHTCSDNEKGVRRTQNDNNGKD